MADADVILRIKVLADATQAAIGLDKAASSTSKFQRGLQKATLPAAAAGAAVIALGKKALDSASDLQQAQGAVEAVFGAQADAVEKNASRAATAMGLSAAQYDQYAALVGTALQNAGMSVRQSVAETDKVMQRGADLSALYGGTTAEAVEAINAAVSRSEFDPLEKYGASLNMTAVNAELAARGQDKLTGAALDTAKKAIILEQVFAKTAKAQNQYAKEADSVAGQTQTASAQFENASAALGQVLLPVVASVTAKLAEMAVWMQKNATTVQILVGVVGGLAAIILTLSAALKVAAVVQGAYNLAMAAGSAAALGTRAGLIGLAVAEKAKAAATLAGAAAQKVATAAQWAFNAAMAANPIMLIILALVALGAAFVIAYKKSETFRNIVQGVWKAITAAAQAAWSVIKTVWDKILNAGKAAFNWIKSNWGLLLAGILAGPFGIAVALIIRHWDKVKAAIRAVFNAVKNIVSDAVSAIVGWVTKAATTYINAWKNAISAIGAAFGVWKNTVNNVVQGVLATIGKVPGAVAGVVAKVKGAFSGASRWLYSAGADIVRGLISGIESLAGWVQSKVEALADAIPGWAKKKLGISSPSKVMAAIGKEVSFGLAMGIEAEQTAVQEASQNIAQLVTDEVSAVITATMKRAAVQRALVRRDGENTKEYKKNSAKRVEAAKSENAAWRKIAAARTKALSADVAAKYKDEAAALDAVNKQREALTEHLEAARDAATAARQQMDDYAQSLRDASKAYAGLAAIKLDEETPVTAANLAAAMDERVQAVQEFANTLDTLRKAGLAEAIIQDLAQAGVEGGLAQARAIAQAGPDAVAQFNTLQTRLNAAANQLATNTSTAMYGAGVQAAEALVAGLAVQQAALDAWANTLADQLAAAIEAALNKALKQAKKGGGGKGGGGGGRSVSRAAPSLLTTTAAGSAVAPSLVGATAGRLSVSASAQPVVINVNGALDPEAVARQIRRVLASHSQRTGGPVAQRISGTVVF